MKDVDLLTAIGLSYLCPHVCYIQTYNVFSSFAHSTSCIASFLPPYLVEDVLFQHTQPLQMTCQLLDHVRRAAKKAEDVNFVPPKGLKSALEIFLSAAPLMDVARIAANVIGSGDKELSRGGAALQATITGGIAE